MDGSDEQLQQAAAFCATLPNLTVGISAERPGAHRDAAAARCYYHAIRFIRFFGHLRHYNIPLWLMDVDALFNRPPTSLFEKLAGRDVAFRARPGRLEPWNQFNASVVGATPGEASKRYFRLIAAYIAHFFARGKLQWGIDQLAMYGAFMYLQQAGAAPSAAFLDDRAVDYDYHDDGIIWCNSGKNKFAHVQKTTRAIPDDPDRIKYIRRFEKYRVE
jgi:hypothetical protein